MFRILMLIAGLLCLAVTAEAAIKTRVIEYRQGETVLEGYLAWDVTKTVKRPGVLVVHEWTGLGPYVKKRAEMLARIGYVALAADIYGKAMQAFHFLAISAKAALAPCPISSRVKSLLCVASIQL